MRVWGLHWRVVVVKTILLGNAAPGIHLLEAQASGLGLCKGVIAMREASESCHAAS